ncbi:MAG TPA: hypothetical protein VMT76_10665 [Puia sp.]|nr:hypothetical protein [Puia sp.]
MKKIFFILMLAMAAGFLHAQQNKKPINQLSFPEIKLQVPPTNFSMDEQFKNVIKPNNGQRNGSPKVQWPNPKEAEELRLYGKSSYQTPNGSHYDLLSDDMPCLAPDMSKVERMPVGKKGLKNIDLMPNGAHKE